MRNRVAGFVAHLYRDGVQPRCRAREVKRWGRCRVIRNTDVTRTRKSPRILQPVAGRVIGRCDAPALADKIGAEANIQVGPLQDVKRLLRHIHPAGVENRYADRITARPFYRDCPRVKIIGRLHRRRARRELPENRVHQALIGVIRHQLKFRHLAVGVKLGQLHLRRLANLQIEVLGNSPANFIAYGDRKNVTPGCSLTQINCRFLPGRRNEVYRTRPAVLRPFVR